MNEVERIANRLVELCRLFQYERAVMELYDPDAVSIEPKGAPIEITSGLNAIRQKGRDWAGLIDKFHATVVSDPLIAGNFFSFFMSIDVTYKGMERSYAEQICLYEVRDGKIAREQFFFDPAVQAL